MWRPSPGAERQCIQTLTLGSARLREDGPALPNENWVRSVLIPFLLPLS
jgi:hypothetical protein